VWVIECWDGRRRAAGPVVWGKNIKEKALFPEPLFIDEQVTWSEIPRHPTIIDVRDDNLRSVRLLQPAGRGHNQRRLYCPPKTHIDR
jgi:hypothetical protein